MMDSNKFASKMKNAMSVSTKGVVDKLVKENPRAWKTYGESNPIEYSRAKNYVTYGSNTGTTGNISSVMPSMQTTPTFEMPKTYGESNPYMEYTGTMDGSQVTVGPEGLGSLDPGSVNMANDGSKLYGSDGITELDSNSSSNSGFGGMSAMDWTNAGLGTLNLGVSILGGLDVHDTNVVNRDKAKQDMQQSRDTFNNKIADRASHRNDIRNYALPTPKLV